MLMRQNPRLNNENRQLMEEILRQTVAMFLLKTEDIHPPKTGISVHFSGSLV